MKQGKQNRVDLVKKLLFFLKPRIKKGDRLLLGLSGGNDSLALLYLLLECRSLLSFSLDVAHIDHGWREVSRLEAKVLSNLAATLGLSFYLYTAQKVASSDRENQARLERLQFFQKLNKEGKYRALLLAHHADDQAETILKRIAEGAWLQGLGGIREEKKMGSLLIYRPLLGVRKEELIAYLEKQNKAAFFDQTNVDPKYLRARMRLSIFPLFESHFGKKVTHHFASFGKRFQKLQSYIEEKSHSIRKRFLFSPFGAYLSFHDQDHPLEIEWVLSKYAREKGAIFSQSSFTTLLQLLEKRTASAKIEASPLTFILNRNHMFILHNPFPNFFSNQDKWQASPLPVGDWRSFWSGFIAYPKKYDRLVALSELSSPGKVKWKEWYRSCGVPSFLYEKAPLFLYGNKLIGECLTGKPLKKNLNNFL